MVNDYFCRCQWINLEIVKRSDAGKFVVLPKRWIVERTIGWLNRCRRLAKGWECLHAIMSGSFLVDQAARPRRHPNISHGCKA
jgi:transposase